MAKPVIAEGALIVSHSKDRPTARIIEAAMAQAILDAYEDGVTDPDEQRALMLAARDKAKQKLKDHDDTHPGNGNSQALDKGR